MDYKRILTIGIPTFDDYDGLFFTINSLRLYHPITRTEEVEFIILDNNPNGKYGKLNKSISKSADNIRYIEYTTKQSTTIKWNIVDFAEGEYILVIDSHVMLAPGAIDELLKYYSKNPKTMNLIQGPLLYEDFNTVSTSFKKGWSSEMYGTWNRDDEYDKGEPFEILFSGMGLFSYRKEAFPKLNQDFRGFGCEEWYVHEKFRQNKGKIICIPKLLWMHRFGRVKIPYDLSIEDKLWNYFIGWIELYKDPEHYMVKSIEEHFKKRNFDIKKIEKIKKEAISYHKNKKTIS